MRFLRWAALVLALATGSLALGGRSATAAPVPSAGLAASGGLAQPLAERTYYVYRRRYYRPRYYRPRFYRPRYYVRRYYGPRFYRPRAYYGRPYYRRRFY